MHANMDQTELEHFYLLLRNAVNFFLHLIIKRDDGKYHLPPNFSPEYKLGNAPGLGDTTYTLGLLRWGLRTLLSVAARSNTTDHRLHEYQSTLENLADFHVSNATIGQGAGLMVAEALSFNYTHRHFSHILPCGNLRLLNWTGTSGGLCERTLDNWAALHSARGTLEAGGWDLFSYAGVVPFNVRAHRSLAALGNLSFVLSHVWPKLLPSMKPNRAAIQPNTLAGEGGNQSHTDPTSETPQALASALQDMLLLSDYGAVNTMIVCGGVPSVTPEAVFYHLRAQGGFLVSGRCGNGTVDFVEVVSERGLPLELKAIFKQQPRCSPYPCTIEPIERNVYRLTISANSSVVVYSGTKLPSLTIEQVPGTTSCFNWWGYRANKEQCDLMY